MWTRPSAENPGPPLKPRSTTASISLPAHSAGTWPLNLNHAVPQAGPHGRPIAAGSKVWARASAGDTGSPGACHTSMSSGTAAP